MWQHDYMPVAHSIGWSALCAAMPLFVLLFLLAIMRKPAWISAIASLATALLMVWVVYRMQTVRILSATLFGIAHGLLPTGWITFNAILLYRLTLETGQFEVIKNSLAMLTSDCRLQALLIAFAFGAFIEGAAGSGVPVAVCAAMLAGMGFNRLKAAGICLLANTAPVAFGAIGLPIIMLQKSTGLDLMHLSAATGRIRRLSSRPEASSPRAVADQGVCRIVRTGRKKPALAPDQGRERQLVGAVRASDDAFVEVHAGAVANGISSPLIASRLGPIKPRRRG